jgi:TolB-like protein
VDRQEALETASARASDFVGSLKDKGRMRTGVFRFGGFVLDVPAYELRRQGRSVRLERRPMELLLLLVDRRGELISRDEIVARLWGRDVFIDIDTSVNTAIRKIRRALRDSADESRFVQTVQGKGYRFIADVEAATSEVLAVLPFENLQGDPNHDYLADGLTEETIVGLGQLDPERLCVIGRRSSMAYRGTSKSLSEIGRELGADYLLEGSVRAAAGRCRVTATLVRAHDQVQIWTEAFERDSNDMLGLQPELGRAIARQIHLRLTPQRTATITKRQTHDAGAYDLYLRGRHYYNQMTPATTARALDCFHRATALDDAYALAWAGIADAYSSRLFASDTRSSDVADQARAAALQPKRFARTRPSSTRRFHESVDIRPALRKGLPGLNTESPVARPRASTSYAAAAMSCGVASALPSSIAVSARLMTSAPTAITETIKTSFVTTYG